jgi:hypothetical protein
MGENEQEQLQKQIITKTIPLGPEEKRKKVAIVGFAGTWNKTPFNDPDFEIWGLNEAYFFMPLAHRWFEIHSRKDFECASYRNPRHLEWLQKCNIPIYMQKKFADIPCSIEFPIKKLSTKYRRYWTNSISFMIAMAIEEKFKEIHIYGVNMAQNGEYEKERPSVEYWIGVAEGQGRKVYIPWESDLCKSERDYGYEEVSPMALIYEARKNEHTAMLNQVKSERQMLFNKDLELRDHENRLYVIINKITYEKPEETFTQVKAERQKLVAKDWELRDFENKILGAIEQSEYYQRCWALDGIEPEKKKVVE